MNGKILRELEAEARAKRKKLDMELSEPAPVNAIADRQCGRGLANCAGTVIVHCPLCGRGKPANWPFPPVRVAVLCERTASDRGPRSA